MEQIKFRHWDEKKIKYLETNCSYFPNPYTAYGVIMQFTGLYDKNGKEIYNGDIIKFQFPKYKDSQRIGDDEFIGIVGENKYYHTCVYVGDKEYHIDRAIFGEIIGNIYENKDLLTN